MSMQEALENVKKTATEAPQQPIEKPKRIRRTKDQIAMDAKKASGQAIPIPMSEGDQAIAELIKLPFDVWANSQELPALKLKNDEAINISKPVKALLDHYLPQVSPIGYVWVSLGLIITNTMTTRLILVSNERAKRKKDNDNNGSEGKRKIDSGKKNTTEEKPTASL